MTNNLEVTMQRELIGYGESLPQVIFPNKARVAINFVLNYEEGAEANILDGDMQSESYLTDLPGVLALPGKRHASVESLFEYGSRVGVWRLLALFDEYRIPLTIFATGLALERNLALADKLRQSPHEIAGHGYRWIHYRNVSEEKEREHIQKTINSIEHLTQKKVAGWYTGRGSINTRKLVVEAKLSYDSDSYADDLPYWVDVMGKPHLVIPYQLDTNDARYAMTPGWSSGEDFFHYLKQSFDCLYREGEKCPKVMSVGLHARLSGRPGRTEALRSFLNYIKQFDRVWVCKREEIFNYWHQNHRMGS